MTVIAPDPASSETMFGRELAPASVDERFFDMIAARVDPVQALRAE